MRATAAATAVSAMIRPYPAATSPKSAIAGAWTWASPASRCAPNGITTKQLSGGRSSRGAKAVSWSGVPAPSGAIDDERGRRHRQAERHDREQHEEQRV